MATSWTVLIVIIVIIIVFVIVIVVVVVVVVVIRISHHNVIVFHEVHDVDWLVGFGVA